jgi:hypothetical protein
MLESAVFRKAKFDWTESGRPNKSIRRDCPNWEGGSLLGSSVTVVQVRVEGTGVRVPVFRILCCTKYRRGRVTIGNDGIEPFSILRHLFRIIEVFFDYLVLHS